MRFSFLDSWLCSDLNNSEVCLNIYGISSLACRSLLHRKDTHQRQALSAALVFEHRLEKRARIAPRAVVLSTLNHGRYRVACREINAMDLHSQDDRNDEAPTYREELDRNIDDRIPDAPKALDCLLVGESDHTHTSIDIRQSTTSTDGLIRYEHLTKNRL
jgi:hypothetical protein